MQIIEPSVCIESTINQEEALSLIERAGRVCYKSEDKISDSSSEMFVRNIISRGHESVIEHVSVTVRVICDRGVSHEIVRHRLASYSQESTRYCNYTKERFGNEITVIKPVFWLEESEEYKIWMKSVKNCEQAYFKLISMGATPQEARAVLPNSLKTELLITMNFREWRHFFRLRCSYAAHPQMQQVARLIYKQFKSRYPLFVEDLLVE